MIHTTGYRPRRHSPAAPPVHMHNGWRAAGRIASAVGIVVLSITAALATVVAVATHFSRNGEYTAFGHPVLTVISGSMTPVIRTGDLIVDSPVTPAQASSLQPGQIISVRETPGSQRIITHRIVAVKVVHGTVSYVTKGDANNAPDSTLRPAPDVVGVFRFAVPRGGYVLAALHRPLVLGLLLASPLLLLLAGPLFRLARKMDDPGDGDTWWSPPARSDWPSPPARGEGGRL
jgi:signal peptidase